ncbi:MAG: hypothetical protein IKK84_00255 [Clostridia bacterium]|nr:hypothetical protein [Clostridia bacterium]
MTTDELNKIGLPITIDDSNSLYVMSALEWLQANTRLEFDKEDLESVKNLPSSAKVFTLKFIELTTTAPNVTSESMAGMSQSFNLDVNNTLLKYAKELLSDVLKSGFSCVPAVNRY